MICAGASDYDLARSLGIMSGYPDGSFGDNNYVTRAELAKILTVMSNTDVPELSVVSPYFDVPYEHWAAAYIDSASGKGYFSGYPDGSFQPENDVLYEELCKVMLAMLGYSANGSSFSWADNQINLAKKVGLLESADYENGNAATRIDTARIIKNTLLTMIKGTDKYYIETMDYKYLEDITIISDKNVQSGYIKTSGGLFKKGLLADDAILKKGGLIVNMKNEIVLFMANSQSSSDFSVKEALPDRLRLVDGSKTESELVVGKDTILYNGNEPSNYNSAFLSLQSGDLVTVFYDSYGNIDYICKKENNQAAASAEYIVKSVLPNGIIVFGSAGDITLKFDDDTAVYEGNLSGIYKTASESLSLGDKITVYYDGFGEAKYFTVKRDAIAGPVTNIGGSYKAITGVNESSKIYRDGIPAVPEEIEDYDVCYYVKEADTLLAYSKKSTGVYENALPNKDNVQKIVLSGKEYEIGFSDAYSKLSSGGGIAYGETITVLFDKDGKIADVIKISASENFLAYLQNTGVKERLDEYGNRHNEYYAVVMQTDGGVQDFYTDKDYEALEGKTVNISFVSGKAVLSAYTAKSSVKGLFDWSGKTLGNEKLSETLQIIDVAFQSEYTQGKGKKIFPQRLQDVILNSSDIICAEKDKNGKIHKLITNNVTNDLYSYGMVLKDERVSTSYAVQGKYDLNINGETVSYTVNKLFPVYTGQAALFDFDNNTVIRTQKLQSVNEKTEKIDNICAYTKTRKYLLSPDVIVYKKIVNTSYDGQRFEVIPLSSIDKNMNITLYYDKSEQSGGRIRIIVADSY